MHDEISYHLFFGPEYKSSIEALETFLMMYIEIAVALMLLILITLIFLSLSDTRRKKPDKTIAVRLSAEKSEDILLLASDYKRVSLSQSSSL